MRRIAHVLPATSAMPAVSAMPAPSAAARRSPAGLSAVPVGFG